MKCPVCSAKSLVSSRYKESRNYICSNCECKFKTIEIIAKQRKTANEIYKMMESLKRSSK